MDKPTYEELAHLIQQLAGDNFDWYSPDDAIIQHVYHVSDLLSIEDE